MFGQIYFRTYIFIIVLIICLLSGCARLDNLMGSSDDYIPVRNDARLDFLSKDGKSIISINVEIPKNSRAITRGLMGPRSLEYSEGMLFIFSKSEPRLFWMHNTRMPLDIIFIDETKKVINICSHTKPMSDNTYASERPAKYVVEVLAGFTELYGITQGSPVAWKPY